MSRFKLVHAPAHFIGEKINESFIESKVFSDFISQCERDGSRFVGLISTYGGQAFLFENPPKTFEYGDQIHIEHG